jgi:DNA modification methylase
MRLPILHNGNCYDILDSLQPESIDAIITDPPYTDGKGKDALAGHKIQTLIDIPLLMEKANRVLKKDSFLAFTIQSPYDLEWRMAAAKYFTHKEHITWVKRVISSPFLPILRMKEELFVFVKGNPKYFKTEGRYEDVKMPMYLDGLLNIGTIKRLISDLRKEIKTGIQRTKKGSQKNNNDEIYNRFLSESIATPACREFVNVTNVWSFTPHNKTSYQNTEFNVKHPTVKPIPLFERLIELLSAEPSEAYTPIILDPFMGSGTTGIAAVQTKRDFIGIELDNDYYEISKNRINKALQKENGKLF